MRAKRPRPGRFWLEKAERPRMTGPVALLTTTALPSTPLISYSRTRSRVWVSSSNAYCTGSLLDIGTTFLTLLPEDRRDSAVQVHTALCALPKSCRCRSAAVSGKGGLYSRSSSSAASCSACISAWTLTSQVWCGMVVQTRLTRATSSEVFVHARRMPRSYSSSAWSWSQRSRRPHIRAVERLSARNVPA